MLNEVAFIDNSGKIVIPNARLLYRNFSGAENVYNHEGDRNCCVFIDDEQLAQQLQELGWNVKIRKPRDEDDTVAHYIKFKVSYKFKGPKVFMHTGPNTSELSEETIGLLDTADIIGADVIIAPSHWEQRDGRTGITGYLDTLHVVIQPDYFADKYGLLADEAPEED